LTIKHSTYTGFLPPILTWASNTRWGTGDVRNWKLHTESYT